MPRRTLVVDIDEKSVQALGPWPWPRERIAQLLGRLDQQGVNLKAIDIEGNTRTKDKLIGLELDFKVGDVLIARGSDGGRPFVPGVPVGVVTSIISNPSSITQTAYVKSMTNLSSLGVVSVVTAAPKNDPRDSLVPKIFLPRIADSVTATATPSASPSAKPSPTKK